MSLELRTTSLDPVQINGWRWQPFLDIAMEALASMQPSPYPVPEQFLQKTGETGSFPESPHGTNQPASTEANAVLRKSTMC